MKRAEWLPQSVGGSTEMVRLGVWGGRACAVEFTAVVLESQLCLCSLTLSKLFNFSELPFLHLFKGLIVIPVK